MTYAIAGDARPQPVPPYARVEVLGGCVMVAIAALVWFGSIDLRLGSIPNFGPGALPRVLATLLVIAGIALVVGGLTRREAALERFDFAYRPTLIILLAICIFGLFIRGGNFGIMSTPQLGLVLVGPVTVLVAGCASPKIYLRDLLVLAFGLTALLLMLFPDLLRLSIPPFPAGFHSLVPPELGNHGALRITYGAYAGLALALYLAGKRQRKDRA